MRSRVPWAVLVAFALIYVVWGSTFLANRYAVEALPPFLMGGIRFTTAGIIMVVLAAARGVPLPDLADAKRIVVPGLLMMTMGHGSLAVAQQTLPSGVAALVLGMIPLAVWAIDGALQPGRLNNGRNLLGILLGIAGMYFLLAPNVALGEPLPLAPALILITGACGWSLGTVLVRRRPSRMDAFMAAGMQTLVGGIALIVLSGIRQDWAGIEWTAVGTRAWFSLGYLIVFGSVIAYSAYVYLLRTVDPTQVATYAFVNPVIALLIGTSIAGEAFGAREAISSALILTAVWMVLRSGRAKHAPQADEEPEFPGVVSPAAGLQPAQKGS